MASIYSKRFAGGSFPAGFSEAVYTVPAGCTAIVRCITARCDSSSSAGLTISGASAFTFFAVETTSVEAVPVWNGRVVLVAGEDIGLVATDEQYEVSISGYLLTP